MNVLNKTSIIDSLDQWFISHDEKKVIRPSGSVKVQMVVCFSHQGRAHCNDTKCWGELLKYA